MQIGASYSLQFSLVMGCGREPSPHIDTQVRLEFSTNHGLTWHLVKEVSRRSLFKNDLFVDVLLFCFFCKLQQRENKTKLMGTLQKRNTAGKDSSTLSCSAAAFDFLILSPAKTCESQPREATRKHVIYSAS